MEVHHVISGVLRSGMRGVRMSAATLEGFANVRRSSVTLCRIGVLLRLRNSRLVPRQRFIIHCWLLESRPRACMPCDAIRFEFLSGGSRTHALYVCVCVYPQSARGMRKNFYHSSAIASLAIKISQKAAQGDVQARETIAIRQVWQQVIGAIEFQRTPISEMPGLAIQRN